MTLEAAPVTAAESTTGASVLRGGLWHLTSKVVPQVFVAIVSVAAARFLGAERFGRQSFIAFAEISVIMLLTGGLPLALSRYLGSSLGKGSPDHVRALVRVAGRLSLLAATLGGGALLAVALTGAEPEAAWALAAVVAFVAMLERIPSAVLIGVQRWRDASTPGLVTGALATGVVVIVLAAGGGITGMFAVEAGVALLLLVWIGALARRALSTLPDRQASKPPVGPMLRYAGVTTISVFLTFVVWRRSEFLFLDHYSPDWEIGYYSIGFSVFMVLGLLPETVGGVLLPAVSTLHGAEAAERINAGYARALRMLTVAALPLTAGALALGPTLVKLVYGESFSRAGTVLLILVAPYPILGLVYASNALLSGIARLRPALVVGLVATVVNLAADFVLIPRYDAVGAAVANVAAQVTAAVPIIFFARKSAGRASLAPTNLLRVAVAAIVGGTIARASIALLGDLPGLLVGTLLGALAFAALSLALRALPRDDLRWLEATSAAPLARVVRRLEERFP